MRMRRGAYSFDAYQIVLGDARIQATFGYSVLPRSSPLSRRADRRACRLLDPAAAAAAQAGRRVHHAAAAGHDPAIVIVFGYIRMYGSNSPLPFLRATPVPMPCWLSAMRRWRWPYMYRAVDTGLRTIDVRTLTEAAQILGAGWGTIITRVILPNVLIAGCRVHS